MFCWPAGCSVCPTSRRRASSPRSLICPSDAWCQRSGTLPAQGGLWRGSAWTSGLHPTATGNRPRIQPAGEVRGPSLAGSEGRMIREKEEGQRCRTREDKEECEWRCECCAVGEKKNNTETTAWCWKLSGAEVIVLEAPADTQRRWGLHSSACCALFPELHYSTPHFAPHLYYWATGFTAGIQTFRLRNLLFVFKKHHWPLFRVVLIVV